MNRKSSDTALAVFFIIVGILVFHQTIFHIEGIENEDVYTSPAFFPQIMGGIILVLAVVLLIRTWVFTKSGSGGKSDNGSGETRETQKDASINSEQLADETVDETDTSLVTEGTDKASTTIRGKSIGVAAALIAYTVLLRYLGYLLLTPLLIASLLWIFEVRKVLTVVSYSIVATGVVYYIFYEVLDVVLPRGILLSLFL